MLVYAVQYTGIQISELIKTCIPRSGSCGNWRSFPYDAVAELDAAEDSDDVATIGDHTTHHQCCEDHRRPTPQRPSYLRSYFCHKRFPSQRQQLSFLPRSICRLLLLVGIQIRPLLSCDLSFGSKESCQSVIAFVYSHHVFVYSTTRFG